MKKHNDNHALKLVHSNPIIADNDSLYASSTSTGSLQQIQNTDTLMTDSEQATFKVQNRLTREVKTADLDTLVADINKLVKSENILLLVNQLQDGLFQRLD